MREILITFSDRDMISVILMLLLLIFLLLLLILILLFRALSTNIDLH